MEVWRRLDRKITEIYVKTLQAVCQEMVTSPSCFELFGFDVIIDEQVTIGSKVDGALAVGSQPFPCMRVKNGVDD